jgi:propionyl-CoA carboxylase alpha chain
VYVHLGDGEAFVQLVPRFPPPRAADEPGTCTSPTPGKVVAVHVAVGDPVAKGQALVVLEAMKMEHRLAAPDAGVVAQVRVRPGDQVEQGALLVRIEPAS